MGSLLVRLSALVLVSACFQPLFAQWEQTAGPGGAPEVRSLVVSGDALFAGLNWGGVYCSVDGGKNWTAKKGGLVYDDVWSMAVSGTKLFAGSNTGSVFISSDNGMSWTNTLSYPGSVRSFAVIGDTIFAGIYMSGVFRSTDGGATWTVSDSSELKGVLSLILADDVVIAGCNFGAFRSTDFGVHWTKTDSGIDQTTKVYAIIQNGTDMFLGTHYDGILRSSDSGISWTQVSTDLEIERINTTSEPPDTDFVQVFSLTVDGTTLLAGTSKGVFTSQDNGGHWVLSDSGIPRGGVLSLLAASGAVLAGTQGSGVFRSGDRGKSWTHSSSGMACTDVSVFVTDGAALLSGTDGAGVFSTTDHGVTWKTAGYSGLPNLKVIALTVLDGDIFVSVERAGNVYCNSGGSGVWTPANGGIENRQVRSLASNGAELFAGTDSGIYVTNDKGKLWSVVNGGSSAIWVSCLAARNEMVVAGTRRNGIFLSTDNGATWEKSTSGIPDTSVVSSVAIVGEGIFVGTNNNGLYYSSDKSNQWQRTAYPFMLTLDMSADIRSITSYGTIVFGNTPLIDVYYSSDSGVSWTAVDRAASVPYFTQIAVHDGFLYGSSYYEGVWRRSLDDIFGGTEKKRADIPVASPRSISLEFIARKDGFADVSFFTNRTDRCTFSIFTLTGMLVAELYGVNVIYGSNRVRWDTRRISAGSYLLRAVLGDETFVRHIVIRR